MTDLPHLIHLVDEPPDDEQPTLPNDAILERIVLAGCLTWRTDIDDVTAAITPADLHQPRHELILHAITHLYARGDPVDIGSVTTRLRELGSLNRVGGQPYLHELATHAITPGNAGYHAHTLAALATRRRLIAAGKAIEALAYKTADDEHTLHQAALTYLEEIPRGVPGVDGDGPASSWAPVDLEDILTGNHQGPVATVCRRRDGKALLYPAAVHSVSGEPGSGKSWYALIACAQELEQERPVAYIDFEDRAQSAVARLLALGVKPDQIRQHFRYVRPDVALDPAATTHLDRAVAGTTVAVIDGITEAMTMHGLSLMDNEDVARWLALVPRRIADLGPAVLQVDHVVKNSDQRGRFAIGGQHKLAGITGVAYKMLTIKSFGKGVKGHAKLVIDKDKHGDVGPNGVTAADLHLDATDPAGALYGWLDTPGQDTGEDGHFRPTTLMKRVSGLLSAQPGASLNEIKLAVRGKDQSIADAVNALILEGFVRTEPGPNRAFHHYLEKGFTDDNE